MSEHVEQQAAQAALKKARQKQTEQAETRRRVRATTTAQSTSNIRRARLEVNRERETRNPTRVEVDARRLERGYRAEKEMRKPFKEVEPLKPRFQNIEAIRQYNQKAWHKLENSPEGKSLFKQMGGKDEILKALEKQGDYTTRIAAGCTLADIEASAAGRNVHKLSELYVLEKEPKAILSGEHQVEQRIDYIGRDGKARHVELDDVTRRGDKITIRDHKPVNLSDFERTHTGKEWAAWAEKSVGPHFRQHVMDGNSPYFQKETRNSMPSHIREGLRDYLKRAEHKASGQLEKYRSLYAEAAGIERENIKATVWPYFVFR